MDSDRDRLVRRGALLAIPLIAIVLYFMRGKPSPKDAPAPALSSAGAQSGSVGGTTPLGIGLPKDLSERGEAAFAEKGAPRASSSTTPPPSPGGTAAAELPLADSTGPTLPRTHGHSSERKLTSHPGQGTCGGIEARLITASEDPAFAFASLSPNADEPATIRRVGERVGGWQVDKIEWDRVWLRGGGGRCAVGMHFGARAAQEATWGDGKTKKKNGLVSAEESKEPWRVPGELSNGIEKISETQFAIEHDLVALIYDRAGDWLAGLRIEPVRRDGAVIGLELGDVRTDSLFERLGFETGDVLLAIDDQRAESLEALAKVLDEAREHSRLVARLERQGQTFDLKLITR